MTAAVVMTSAALIKKKQDLAQDHLFFSAHAVRVQDSDSHQRLVVGQLFSGCKRTGECKKPDVFRLQKQNKLRNTNTN